MKPKRKKKEYITITFDCKCGAKHQAEVKEVLSMRTIKSVLLEINKRREKIYSLYNCPCRRRCHIVNPDCAECYSCEDWHRTPQPQRKEEATTFKISGSPATSPKQECFCNCHNPQNWDKVNPGLYGVCCHDHCSLKDKEEEWEIDFVKKQLSGKDSGAKIDFLIACALGGRGYTLDFSVERSNQARDSLQKNFRKLFSQLLKETLREGIMEKLHKIEEEKTIYDIHYCRAGVGFIFYYPDKDKGSWREALSVERYYDTFEEAVEAEYNKLKEEGK